MSFTPSFRTDVVVNNPDGSNTPVNPTYCLTDASAIDLMCILDNAGYPSDVVEGWPLGNWGDGGGFQQSSKVPFLDFGGGHVGNAGLIASAWTHGLSDDVALRYAVTDVQNLLRGN